MPFVSLAQEKYMKMNLPDLYKKWVAKYGKYSGKRKRKSPKTGRNNKRKR